MGSYVSRSEIRQQAIALYRAGNMYPEISSELGVPKSTLSYWFSRVELTDEERAGRSARIKERLGRGFQALNAARKPAHVKLVADQEKAGAEEITLIGSRDLFFLFLGLYLGEGDKRDRWRVGFSNSDEAIIRMAMRFFREWLKIADDKVHPAVTLHRGGDIDRARAHWAKATGLPLKSFKVYEATSSASKGKRPVDRLPMGTLQLTIHDARLKRRINGWMAGVAKVMDDSSQTNHSLLD